jgi:N6-adenosine-specific RNA methylase IME4
MAELVRYEAACRAVAEARTLDEAKDIRDKAIAMAAYARQAKNKDLEADAVEIKMRAVRRLGEMIQAQRETVGLNTGARGIGKSVVPDGNRTPTLADAGIDKKLSSYSQKLAAIPAKAFEATVARTREAVQRTVKIETDRNDRLLNIAEISRGNAVLGTDQRYPIIYADPPWRYENPPIGASSRSIENQYPTMTLAEIGALPVSDLAADDAMLYLWATAPKLAECLWVIEAWGFEYRTNMVWDKEIIGMGYHARNQHELLLIAKRGSIPPPAAGTQPSSVHRERRGEHSAKPKFYYEMIEAAYPQLAKIELFCRSPREGWVGWGNQAVAA